MKAMIKELRENQSVTTFLLLGSFELRRTKSGKEFLHLRLYDRTGSISGFIWKEPKLIIPTLRERSFVKVRGFCKVLNGSLVMEIDRIRKADSGEVDPKDFFGVVPGGISYWYERLLDSLRLIENRQCRALIRSFLEDQEFLDRFKTSPGGTSYHHPYRGGLLEHTVMSMSQAALISERLSGVIDRDLLLTGCFLHDIGKTRELTDGLIREYTTEGRLLGHIGLGLLMLEEKISGIGGFSEDLSLLLGHMILSHHGRPEHGSPIKHLTPEAIVLNLIEGADATLNHLYFHLKGSDPNQLWSRYDRFLKSEIYIGKKPKLISGKF
jgi:3'-5' exoribonuclease